MRKRQRKKNFKKRSVISKGTGTPAFDFSSFDHVAVKLRGWSGGVEVRGAAEVNIGAL